jgi:hypothetical protein
LARDAGCHPQHCGEAKEGASYDNTQFSITLEVEQIPDRYKALDAKGQVLVYV